MAQFQKQAAESEDAQVKEFAQFQEDAEWAFADLEAKLETAEAAAKQAAEAAYEKVKQAAKKEPAATEVQAAKKAKVGSFAKVDIGSFDNVDMQLEALAHRIDTMPSVMEADSWRRAGWKCRRGHLG